MTGLSGTPLYLFAIVFFWTPPHFWSLSLLMKDEYARAGVPTLPVVRGEAETRRQIMLYTILLYAVSQLPFCAGAFGVTYLICSVVLGAGFIFGAWRLLRHPALVALAATRRARLDPRLFFCGGPSLPRATVSVYAASSRFSVCITSLKRSARSLRAISRRSSGEDVGVPRALMS